MNKSRMLLDYSSFLYTFHLNVTCRDSRANQGKLFNIPIFVSWMFDITLILYLYCPIALTYDNEIDFPWLVHRYETMCIIFITCRLYTVG
jgi:hypothetical protein